MYLTWHSFDKLSPDATNNSTTVTPTNISYNKHTDMTSLFGMLLTSWNRDRREKLTLPQLLKKFPAVYGTRKFITVLTKARHLSLTWVRSIQSTPTHPISRRPILILSPIYTWVCQVVSFPQVFPLKPCMHLSSPHTCYMPRPSQSSWLDLLNDIWWVVQSIKLLVM